LTAKKQIFQEAVNLPWTFPYGPKDSLAFGFNSADTSQEPEGKGIQRSVDRKSFYWRVV